MREDTVTNRNPKTSIRTRHQELAGEAARAGSAGRRGSAASAERAERDHRDRDVALGARPLAGARRRSLSAAIGLAAATRTIVGIVRISVMMPGHRHRAGADVAHVGLVDSASARCASPSIRRRVQPERRRSATTARRSGRAARAAGSARARRATPPDDHDPADARARGCSRRPGTRARPRWRRSRSGSVRRRRADERARPPSRSAKTLFRSL